MISDIIRIYLKRKYGPAVFAMRRGFDRISMVKVRVLLEHCRRLHYNSCLKLVGHTVHSVKSFYELLIKRTTHADIHAHLKLTYSPWSTTIDQQAAFTGVQSFLRIAVPFQIEAFLRWVTGSPAPLSAYNPVYVGG